MASDFEDDGETLAYTGGQRALTHLAQSWQGERLRFTVDPLEGDPSLVPARRAWTLVFHGLRRPEALEVRLDGTLLPQLVLPYCWTDLAIVIRLSTRGTAGSDNW